MKKETIMIRISDVEKAAWFQAAAAKGMTLSEFIRFVVNAKIEQGRISEFESRAQ